jgi:hypothetical protein
MRNLIRLLDGCLRKQDPPFQRATLEAVIRNERDSLMGLISADEWELLLRAVSRQDVQGDEDYNILVRSLFYTNIAMPRGAGLASTPCWQKPSVTRPGRLSRHNHECPLQQHRFWPTTRQP